ncbi:hypothetical protein NMYAN_150045 [Nitrosomonas nitrosa]|uniref:Uncharacterized protein n=1 Tax=Nitrosomonas nitrosa TaxID=52442 RepID=A0A8H8Z079_9PROT|nr:hypothetical protein NMYAN_150045 [Nitrosomonas nitrosa]
MLDPARMSIAQVRSKEEQDRVVDDESSYIIALQKNQKIALKRISIYSSKFKK